MRNLLVAAAVGAAAFYWFFVRGRDDAVDRVKGAASDAGERIAEAAGTARATAESAAARVKEATGA